MNVFVANENWTSLLKILSAVNVKDNLDLLMLLCDAGINHNSMLAIFFIHFGLVGDLFTRIKPVIVKFHGYMELN
jgi:hypothetical protein